MPRRRLFFPLSKTALTCLAGDAGPCFRQINDREGNEKTKTKKEGPEGGVDDDEDRCDETPPSIRPNTAASNEGMSTETRTELWLSELNRPGNHTEAALNYGSYLEQVISSSVSEAIAKDVGRTFPQHDLFITQEGQRSMQNVLEAYAAYDAEVGYCQGMNFLAGLLLLHLPREEDAFGALVLVMRERGLRDLYKNDMSLFETYMWQLNRLIPGNLKGHLESLGALPVLFASPWFFTCFAHSFPIEIAARVMDIVLCDVVESFLLKLSYTILMSTKKCLMSMDDMVQVLDFLRNIVPNWGLSQLHEMVSDALQSPWSKEQKMILHNSSIMESVHDTILRVEDALSSTECRSEKKLARHRHRHRLHRAVRRSISSLHRLLPHVLIAKILRFPRGRLPRCDRPLSIVQHLIKRFG